MIWEVPASARTASASERLEALAQPKHLPSGYMEDRQGYDCYSSHTSLFTLHNEKVWPRLSVCATTALISLE